MRRALQLVSWLALAGIVIPPVLYFAGGLTLEAVKTVTMVATILWFVATPFWMNSRSSA
jgi:hypothetical protein